PCGRSGRCGRQIRRRVRADGGGHGLQCLGVHGARNRVRAKSREETDRREDGKPQRPEPQVDRLARTPGNRSARCPLSLALTSRLAIRLRPEWLKARPASPKARESLPP